jgi:predicted O-methyltransferase YrrM
MSFAAAWSSVRDVEGWLTEDQARVLFDAASRVRPGEWIVEIGSHQGRSTIVMAAAKSEGVKLLAVDPFDDPRWGGGPESLARFTSNLRDRGLLEEVKVERNLGSHAGAVWGGAPVAMLYVDGAHDYPTVRADIKAWAPHLTPTAQVLLHDAFSSPGVTRAVFRELVADSRYRFVQAAGSLVHFARGAHSVTVRVGGYLRMAPRIAWFGRNIGVKYAMRRQWPLVERLLGHRPGDGCPY